MDNFASQGTITVEFYDGSSDFSESDDDDEEKNVRGSEESIPTTALRSSSNQILSDPIAFKTYDFKHPDTERDYSDSESETNYSDSRKPVGRKMMSEKARLATDNHYTITEQEHLYRLTHPKASFTRCPRGGIADPYSRRCYPGPFLTCPLGHECGDEFSKIPISTKPFPEVGVEARLPHLKERKARFFKQCKNCESLAFTHHRNPAQHYEDYLNIATYKQHHNHTKIWPQHLADLRHILEDNSHNFDEELANKCKNYEPSALIVDATRYSRSIKKRRATVLTRRRLILPRLPRRLPKAKPPKLAVSDSDKSNTQTNLPVQNDYSKASIEAPKASAKEKIDIARNAPLFIKPPRQTNASLPPIQSSQSSSEANIVKSRDAVTEILRRRLRAHVPRPIKSRQTQSKISKQFVKKPEPPKEAKYIPKLKPNISAKFLRQRNKKTVSSVAAHRREKSKHNVTTAINRYKKSNQTRTSTRLSQRKNAHTLSSDDDSSGEGSYAKFRDQNGEFDGEMYRQSILKMLSRPGKQFENERKKKRITWKERQANPQMSPLPKIKNQYSNVKSKIASNVPPRRRKTCRKSRIDCSLDISDFSLKSKFSNDTVTEVNESYFSTPELEI